jgi:hypothetical protein
MRRVWILDTETKGTGAHMVPLEKVLRKPEGRRELPYVPKPRAPRVEQPAPRRPRIFRVVDVMTREVLAEGTTVHATVDALRDVRSVVDVSVSVWEPESERWRQLTLPEQRALWEFRERQRPTGQPVGGGAGAATEATAGAGGPAGGGSGTSTRSSSAGGKPQ